MEWEQLPYIQRALVINILEEALDAHRNKLGEPSTAPSWMRGVSDAANAARAVALEAAIAHLETTGRR